MITGKLKVGKGKIVLAGALLMVILSVSMYALTSDERSALESELSLLSTELNDSGYAWLTDYNVSYPSVEVYTKDGNDTIAVFDNISIGWNKIYLSALEGSYDTFDLLSVGDVWYDYVVDPTYGITMPALALSSEENVTIDGSYAHLKESSAIPYNSLVGYWSFDIDRNDTGGQKTAYDLSGGNNDGTYYGNANASSSCGMYNDGGCFDGDGDYVDMGNPDSLKLNDSVNGMTISTWAKFNQIGTYEQLVGKGIAFDSASNMDYSMGRRNTNLLLFDVSNGTNTIIFLASATDLSSADVWYHLVATWDGTTNTNGVRLYINGVNDKNGTSSQSISSMTTNRNLGISTSSASYTFNGSIDEVMIFNSSLNSTQIQAIYNNQSARFRGSGVVSAKSIPIEEGNATYGLSVKNYERNYGSNISARLGEWDVSHGYNDYDFGEHWAEFDGNGDYVDVGETNLPAFGTTNFSISAWVRHIRDDNHRIILSKGGIGSGDFTFYKHNDDRLIFYADSGSISATHGALNSWPDNQWVHVVAVREGSNLTLYQNMIAGTSDTSAGADLNDATDWKIGSGYLTWDFNGSIDEVMIWNRSLSADEVSELYSLGRDIEYYDDNNLVSWWGFDKYRNATSIFDKKGTNHGSLFGNVTINSTYSGLVGYWHLDNNSLFGENNSRVYDFSGNGNNGTFSVAADSDSGPSNSGVFDGSFMFDGVDGGDYVLVDDNGDGFGKNVCNNGCTFSAWARKSDNVEETMIGRYHSTNDDRFFSLYVVAGNTVFAIGKNGNSSTCSVNYANRDIVLETWYHFVGVYDNSTGTGNVSVYRDGVHLQSTTCSFSGINATAWQDDEDVFIGALAEGTILNEWNGSIDEVMIFNRSLSAAEINELYIKGRARFDFSEAEWQELNALDGNDNSSFNIFNINSETSSIRPQFLLSAGTNNFYTPFVIANPQTSMGNATLSTEYPGIDSCGDLTVENAVYKLGADVTSTGTCFNVLANNITLDCQGHEINYSTAGVLGYGVNVSGYNFTTVKNCVVKEGSSTTYYKYGIYSSGANNLTIYNNTISTLTLSDPVRLLSGFYNNVTANTISTQGSDVSYGIYFSGVTNSTIAFNNLHANSGTSGRSHNIYLVGNSNSNFILNNTMSQLHGGSQSTSHGIKIETNNNQISGNIINTASTYGVSLYQSTNNTLTSNQVNTSQSQSYVVYGTSSSHYNQTIDSTNLAEGKPVLYNYSASNAVILNNSNNEWGQVICAYCNNVTYNNVTMNEGDGINLFYTTNSTVSNSNINTSKGYGVYLYQNSNNNNILNNNINTSGSYGYGVYLYDDCYYNNVLGNNINTSGTNGHGIAFDTSSNNQILSNTINSFSNGIALVNYAYYNNVSSNNITASTGATVSGGIVLNTYGSNNQFHNNNIITNGAVYGIEMRTSSNNSFSKMNIQTNGGDAIHIYIGAYNFSVEEYKVS